MTEDFRALARRRLDEAQALYDVGMWSGSYYLAGYSVECALKACVLKSIKRYHMPDKALVNEMYTHDLQKLVKIAGLESARGSFAASRPAFAANWATVKDWNESSRYETWTAQDAEDLLAAIKERGSGVLGWIKRHW
ncbi:HEPN domain-containing protein [Pseudonocardia pini]|uniref:HEPN domain-containing protein n=1 Tax=Pseudonocardia pini TaxID=2758030 RepID=UPI0015F0070D|nr:HEPN domain-containing protein [Pseudonocardia pini]